jgi:hypothetical protein
MPGSYRIVFKSNDGNQIGVLDAYESLVYDKIASDIGPAVLIANYGVTDANDTLLDSITTDTILEVQRHADLTDPDLDWYVDWIGFCRDRKALITEVNTRKVAWSFVHANHLLKRRLIIPPSHRLKPSEGRFYSNTRWSSSGLINNVIRDLVREQCVQPEEMARKIVGLFLQDNEPETGGTGEPGICFPTGNEADLDCKSCWCFCGWLGELFIGIRDEDYQYEGIWRTTDAETWTGIITGKFVMSMYIWDDGGGERMYYGAGELSGGYGDIYRSGLFDPTTWTQVYNGAGWATLDFEVFDNGGGERLYACTGGNWFKTSWPDPFPAINYYGSGNIIRSDVGDGTTWTRVFSGGYDNGPLWTGKYQSVGALKTFGSYLYAGAVYIRTPHDGNIEPYYQARILRSSDGSNWSVVFRENGPYTAKNDQSGGTSQQYRGIDGFTCFAEFGGDLYAGIGDRINPKLRDGRIYRLVDENDDGTENWEQVFGGNVNNAHDAPGITCLFVWNNILWAGAGGDKEGDAAVWYSLDGDNWYQIFDSMGYRFYVCQDLYSYKGNLYAAMGQIMSVGDQRDYNFYGSLGSTQYYYQWETLGAIWRATEDNWTPPDWYRQGSGRFPNLIDILKKLAESTWDSQGGSDFGIEPVDYGGDSQEWLFIVREPWGTDRRSTSSDPTIIGVSRGNMGDPEYATQRGDRANVVYAIGQGEEEEQIILKVINSQEMNESLWNRYEGSVDVKQATNRTELWQLAKQEAAGLRGPGETFNFEILETPSTRYGAEWDVGDLLTGQFDDIIAHVKVVSAKVSLGTNPATEIIDSEIRLLEVL